MRQLGRVLFLFIILIATFGLQGVARSACVAPELLIQEDSPLAPGDTVRVRGRYWTGECNDVISCSNGCGGRCTGGEPETPAANIVVSLRPAGQNDFGTDIRLLEGIDAGPGLDFSEEVTLPRVADGRYVLVGSSAATGAWESEPLRIKGSAGSD
jgi:hypothetical protein